MKNLATGLPCDKFEKIREIADAQQDPDIRTALTEYFNALKSGDQIAQFSTDETLTPNQAAAQLRMSRTHLYKLLDNGTIPSTRVGRDRRIAMTDLLNFKRTLDAEKIELAERFAHQQRGRDALISELADGL